MAYSIDDTTYNRTRTHKLRDGYQTRGGLKPSSIVIHSTNGRKGSSFASEASYLRDAAGVSTHYLVGKEGQIALIVPPQYQAWHAGVAAIEFANSRSLGIECHHAVGEQWTQAQFGALAWLVRTLIQAYAIPERLIETHRAVALPKGRKVDPSDWPDGDFYAWRASLFALVRPYKARVPAPIFQDRRPDAPLWGYIDQWKVEMMDDLTAGWLHLQSEVGFSPVSCWEPL